MTGEGVVVVLWDLLEEVAGCVIGAFCQSICSQYYEYTGLGGGGKMLDILVGGAGANRLFDSIV